MGILDLVEQVELAKELRKTLEDSVYVKPYVQTKRPRVGIDKLESRTMPQMSEIQEDKLRQD